MALCGLLDSWEGFVPKQRLHTLRLEMMREWRLKFSEILSAHGLFPKTISTTAARKLIKLVYGILKSDRPLDPPFSLQDVRD
jgi:hypothetical protein